MKFKKQIFILVICSLFYMVFYLFKKDRISNENKTAVISNDSNSFKKPNQLNVKNSVFNYLPTTTSNQIIVHDYYTLSYKEEFEQAEWVAYELKGNNFRTHFERPFFIEDPQVKTHSADWKNYKNSGFDKGHLCPAGDMKFSKNAFEATFYTSNIAPQLPKFNNGIWNRLEQKTRFWATKYKGIYIVTGGILTKNLKTIGKEKVAIPDYFYKIILNNSNGNYKMIAFIIPHQESEKPLYEYVVSVDDIEKKTGIDFFPNLNDEIENRLEKQSNYKEWVF